jgi:hypothetical protein
MSGNPWQRKAGGTVYDGSKASSAQNFARSPSKTLPNMQTIKPVVNPPPENYICRARVIASYTPQDITDSSIQFLPLVKDEEVFVLEQDASGWWEGVCNGQKGVFPGSYVEVIEEYTQAESRLAEADSSSSPLKYFVFLASYNLLCIFVFSFSSYSDFD